MKSDRNRNPKLKNLLILLPIIIIITLIAEISYIVNFNQKQHVVKSTDKESDVTMTIAGRSGDANKWVKRDFELNGEQINLNGQTMEGAFVNNSSYEINDWTMRIDITDDCMFNQFWCGTVEIHQHVNTSEKVQTLDLRNCSPEEVELDYIFEGDLLIPLSEGDYLIYYPSSKERELPVDKNSKLTMGFIIYYLEEPDISNYSITYTYNRSITDGYNIYIVAVLLLIWIIMLMLYITSDLAYKKAVKEMKIKKSGILCLSDMYSIIYLINLATNEMTPLVTDDSSELLKPSNMSASEQLINMFETDSADNFKELALEFCDFSTLEQRLKGRNTIAFEYLSKNYGWCRTRFFAMDREETGKLEKVLFAIQNVNDEKAEVEAVAHRAEKAEYENKAKSTFLANMSHEIRTPINTVIGLNSMILRESTEPAIKSYARNISSASNMLLSIINGILDISKLEADKMNLVSEEYSVRELLTDIVNMVKNRIEFNKLEFICNISETLPDRLCGDAVRLKQVIVNLITNALKYTDEGSITLSVFGTIHDNKVHLLFSVKDTGIGIRDEDLVKLLQKFTRFDDVHNHKVSNAGIGLNLVSGILHLMDSEIHILSKYGEGSEFYFEIEQDIIDHTPVGKIDFDEPNTEDTDCHTSSAKADDETDLPVIPGIDVAYAVTHTGGLKNYLAVLNQFVTTAASDADELQTYVSTIKTTENSHSAVNKFKAKIHAMKALTNILGAFPAYGLAAMLEDAAIHDDIKTIQDITPYFLDKWSELRSLIEESLSENRETQ